MEPVLIGYFPKRTALPADFGASHLRDICSVSTCIADGPPHDWIGRWLHNENGVFATRERALEALQGVDPSAYQIHAYRMLPLEFNADGSAPVVIPVGPPTWDPNQRPIEPLPESFRRLGFDAVELTKNSMFFSCSPLSCNGGWSEFETNEHCLVDEMAVAIDLAGIFSQGNWEPGPYRVVEVLADSHT